LFATQGLETMHRRLENIFYEIRSPILTWEDIGGYAAAKEALREMVCLPIQKRSEMEEMGLVPPAGVLLWGPLGTGMTMLPEACAAEVGATFVYISGQEMLGKHGDLSEAFRQAESESPAILYISDIDWLAPRAGAGYGWLPGGEPGNERGKPPTFGDAEMTATLIREIDRLQERGKVTLVGGCYRVDVVDQAVIREKSRFNRKVFLPPPDASARREILSIYTSRIPSEGDLDLEELARRTEGYVGWDIENLVKKAGLLALEGNRKEIRQQDLLAAIASIRPWLTPEMTAGYHRLYKEDCPHHYHF
jgi:transitional endoplasmic reticulum ATPase